MTTIFASTSSHRHDEALDERWRPSLWQQWAGCCGRMGQRHAERTCCRRECQHHVHRQHAYRLMVAVSLRTAASWWTCVCLAATFCVDRDCNMFQHRQQTTENPLPIRCLVRGRCRVRPFHAAHTPKYHLLVLHSSSIVILYTFHRIRPRLVCNSLIFNCFVVCLKAYLHACSLGPRDTTTPRFARDTMFVLKICDPITRILFLFVGVYGRMYE